MAGVNSEKVLHGVQNWIHSNIAKGTPYFADMGYKSQPWSYFGNYNKNALIY